MRPKLPRCYRELSGGRAGRQPRSRHKGRSPNPMMARPGDLVSEERPVRPPVRLAAGRPAT